MSISFKQLEAFVAVADLGGFRRAAERLNTTQPNISARIAGLEGRLGVTLMERDAGSVRLTPKGEALLAHARGVLRGMEDFIAAAGDDALFEGVIRLGVTEMIVHSWLGDFLKALKARYPNVLVELTADFSATLSRGLFSRTLDLTFQSGPFDRPSTGHAALDAYPLIWAAAPSLGLPDGRVSVADLTAHPLLVTARGTTPFAEITAHLAAAGASGARPAPSTNMAAARRMAVDGLGVACLPQAMLAADIAAGRLRRAYYPWTPEPLLFAARFEAERAAPFVRGAVEIAVEIAGAEDKNFRS